MFNFPRCRYNIEIVSGIRNFSSPSDHAMFIICSVKSTNPRTKIILHSVFIIAALIQFLFALHASSSVYNSKLLLILIQFRERKAWNIKTKADWHKFRRRRRRLRDALSSMDFNEQNKAVCIHNDDERVVLRWFIGKKANEVFRLHFMQTISV